MEETQQGREKSGNGHTQSLLKEGEINNNKCIFLMSSLEKRSIIKSVMSRRGYTARSVFVLIWWRRQVECCYALSKNNKGFQQAEGRT